MATIIVADVHRSDSRDDRLNATTRNATAIHTYELPIINPDSGISASVSFLCGSTQCGSTSIAANDARLNDAAQLTVTQSCRWNACTA